MNSPGHPTPPWSAISLLERALPAGAAREGAIGDLHEAYAERRETGRWAADVWFWTETLRLIARYLGHRASRRIRRRATIPPPRGDHSVHTLRRDLLHALRGFARQPGFTIVAVFTLALGIGANTAIFSIVRGVLLRELPYADPDRIVRLQGVLEVEGYVSSGTMAYPNLMDLRDRSTTLAGLAAFDEWAPTILGDGPPERLVGGSVNASFFEILGIEPAAGRFFLSAEDEPGHDPVVVLAYGFWQRRFAGAADIVGRTINLSGTAYTVVGIAPARFEDPDLHGRSADPQVWRATPSYFDISAPRNGRSFTAIGRVASHATAASAETDLREIMASLAAEYPDENARRSVRLVSLREQLVGPVRPALTLLMASVGLVLLIACANVANLMLSRGAGRGREIALRTALGARRRRIVVQLFVESLVLALTGGIIGVLAASAGTRALVNAAGSSLPRADGIGIDGTVLVFSLVASVATGVLFGLLPALTVSRVDLSRSLNVGTRDSAPGGHTRYRSGLVVAEIAMSMTLLVAAGLLIKSLWTLEGVDTGLQPNRLLTFGVSPSARNHPEYGDLTRLYENLTDRIVALPGVEAVGITSILPMSGSFNGMGVQRDDRPAPPRGQGRSAEARTVSPTYFDAIGMRLLRGRGFASADDSASVLVAIVNEAMARSFFPGEDPLGKRITMVSASREIVGVVADVRQFALGEEPRPAVYTPHAQEPAFWTRSNMKVVVRAASDPLSIAPAVRATVWEVDETLPIYDLQSMRRVVAETAAAPRFRTAVLALFAISALALSAVGIAGVTAYTVAQRVQEIGIRMALGARRGDVITMVVVQVLRLAGLGLALGFVGALAIARLLSGLLYNVAAYDVGTFVIGSAVLLTVALGAGYIPAARASRIEPIRALREA